MKALTKVQAQFPVQGIIPFEAIQDVYLDSLMHNSGRTRELYSHALAEFFEWLRERGREGIQDILPIDVIDYRGTLQAKLDGEELKASTAQLKLVAVRNFLINCAVEGFLRPRFTKDWLTKYLKSPKVKGNGRLVWLCKDEIEKLLSAVDDKRDYALINLALGSGLRVSELVDLRMGDIEPLPDDCALLFVANGKGDKSRLVKIKAKAWLPLKSYIEAIGRSWQAKDDLDSYVFQTRQSEQMSREYAFELVQGYAKRAGLTKKVGV